MSSKSPKCNKPSANAGVNKAIQVIESAMKRNHLSLGDVYRAASIMLDRAVEDTIMRMRAAGASIKKISRAIHMDDRRVSAIIKAATSKPCKPCKTCKKCKK